MIELNEKEDDVLKQAAYCYQDPYSFVWDGQKGWFRPMDVGGRDQSHHSRTLKKLIDKGLMKRTRIPGYKYRLTPAGVELYLSLTSCHCATIKAKTGKDCSHCRVKAVYEAEEAAA